MSMCPVACEHPSGTFGRVACVLTLKSALFAAERLAPFGGLGAQRGSGETPLIPSSGVRTSRVRTQSRCKLLRRSIWRQTVKPTSRSSPTPLLGKMESRYGILWNGDLTLLSRWLDLCERKIPKVNRTRCTVRLAQS